jgi:hypothetical protein
LARQQAWKPAIHQAGGTDSPAAPVPATAAAGLLYVSQVSKPASGVDRASGVERFKKQFAALFDETVKPRSSDGQPRRDAAGRLRRQFKLEVQVEVRKRRFALKLKRAAKPPRVAIFLRRVNDESLIF